MKKFLLGAMILAMAVSVTGCDLNGTVKNVKTTYTFANYSTHKMIKKTVSGVATETNNVKLSIDELGPGNHFVVNTPSSSYYVSSNSAGLWLDGVQGLVVDPAEGADTKFATNAMCAGAVRVSGTGTYDPVTGDFSGSGQFIVFPYASMTVAGGGKWTSVVPPTSIYKGVAKVTITPAIAYLVNVTGDTPGIPIPVAATISTSGVALNATVVLI